MSITGFVSGKELSCSNGTIQAASALRSFVHELTGYSMTSSIWAYKNANSDILVDQRVEFFKHFYISQVQIQGFTIFRSIFAGSDFSLIIYLLSK